MPSVASSLAAALAVPSSSLTFQSSAASAASAAESVQHTSPPILEALTRLSSAGSTAAAAALIRISLRDDRSWRLLRESGVLHEVSLVSAAVVQEVLAGPAHARGLNDAVAWAMRNGAHNLAFKALTDERAMRDWDNVRDGEFARIVEAAAVSDRKDVLRSEALVRRLRVGYEVGSAAAGRVYAAVAGAGGSEFLPHAWAAVADWPERFGSVSDFRLGQLSYAGSNSRDQDDEDLLSCFISVRNISEGDNAVRLYVTSRGWTPFEAGRNEITAERLAAAYVAAPKALSPIASEATGESEGRLFENATARLPLSMRGDVDEQIETAVRGAVTVNGAAMNNWSGGMTLRRIALVHPLLLARRIALLAGGVCLALGEGQVQIAADILCALEAIASVPGVAPKAFECGTKGLKVALGGGRALHGVRDGFGKLAISSCQLLSKVADSEDGFRLELGTEVRKSVASAKDANSTEAVVRNAFEKYLEK